MTTRSEGRARFEKAKRVVKAATAARQQSAADLMALARPNKLHLFDISQAIDWFVYEGELERVLVGRFAWEYRAAKPVGEKKAPAKRGRPCLTRKKGHR